MRVCVAKIPATTIANFCENYNKLMSQNNTIDILHDMKKVCITIYNIDYNNNQTLY